MESGRISMTIPEFPTSSLQRYVNTENAGLIPNEKEMLEYCKEEPRTRLQIGRHFGMLENQQRKLLLRLVQDGKLLELLKPRKAFKTI